VTTGIAVARQRRGSACDPTCDWWAASCRSMPGYRSTSRASRAWLARGGSDPTASRCRASS